MDAEDTHEADAIVANASRRGLGGRPILRRISAALWAAFLGAGAMLAVLTLVPEEWLKPPVEFGRLATMFAVCFGLALIPATGACLLMGSTKQQAGSSKGNSDAR